MSPPYSLRLNRVFGPSLCRDKIWYAVSTEWCSRPRHFSAETPFRDDFAEVSIYDLTDQNGARVDPSWFGSTRKKDMVLVSTLFGIMARTIRAKNPSEEKVMSSVEFKAIKQVINSLPITGEMAGSSQFPASYTFPETPPSTPSPRSSPAAVDGSSSKLASNEAYSPFEEASKLEIYNTGPRIHMKQARAVATNCLLDLKDQCKPFELGKVFGYGILYCLQEHQDFVKEVFSTAVDTVAEKQGIEKALVTMLSDDLNQKYVDSLRVPDWIQLYVKLSTKMPNTSWQTLLNFLNIGRSGVSFSFTCIYCRYI